MACLRHTWNIILYNSQALYQVELRSSVRRFKLRGPFRAQADVEKECTNIYQDDKNRNNLSLPNGQPLMASSELNVKKV